MKNFSKNIFVWIIISLILLGLFNVFKNSQRDYSSVTFTYSTLLDKAENGDIKSVEIQGNNIKGVYSNGKSFITYSPNDPNLIEKLSSKGVSISAAPIDEKMPSLFGVLLSWFPMLLLIAVWIFFMRQMQGGKGGAMGFGRSKAKMMNELKGKVTFNDGKRGGSWECRWAVIKLSDDVQRGKGDPFNLKSGKIPFVMPKNVYPTLEMIAVHSGVELENLRSVSAMRK